MNTVNGLLGYFAPRSRKMLPPWVRLTRLTVAVTLAISPTWRAASLAVYSGVVSAIVQAAHRRTKRPSRFRIVLLDKPLLLPCRDSTARWAGTKALSCHCLAWNCL